MSYIDGTLVKNEKLIALYPFHWMVKAAAWVWTVVLVLFALVGLAISPLVVLVPLGVMAYMWLWICRYEQGLTTRRVIIKKGVIGVKTEEIQLAAVETIRLEQRMLERLLGFGKVELTGRGISTVKLRSVVDPLAVKKQIEEIQEKYVR